MKTSFETRVSQTGLGSLVDIYIYVLNIFFYLVSSYSPFLSNLLNQNLQNVKTPKRKLWSFVQRYSFKFWALAAYKSVRYFCVQSSLIKRIRFKIHQSQKGLNIISFKGYLVFITEKLFVFRRKKKTASFKFLEGFYEIHKLLNLTFGRKQFLAFLLFICKRKMKKNIKFKAAPTTSLILLN